MKFSFRDPKKTSNLLMYNKAITSNDTVRNKFKLELSNLFQNLDINEDDTIQTACDKLKQAFNEATSNSYLKREKNTIKLSVSTQSSDLIEQ